MNTSEIIALCALGLSALMAITGNRRNAQSDAAAQAKVEAKLDNVARGVDDIRMDLRALKSDISAHSAKLAELEGSCKSAHHRIDEIFSLYRKAHPPDTK